MVCDGMRWYAMVCDGMVIPYHSDPSRNCARVFTKNALIVNMTSPQPICKIPKVPEWSF